MIRSLLTAALLGGIAPAPAPALPNFVAKPSDIYVDFVALEMPRTEVPVGALWVQGYGPTGEGASADNLVMERSLTTVTINTELQLALTAGVLNLFGLDPSYRNKLSARFSDLSVVRVKDMSKLSGPATEPRIYEALRAASVTITTDNEAGVDLNARIADRKLPIISRSDNGRRRSFSIDGKDMFIAFRVASQKDVRSERKEVRLTRSEGGWQTRVARRDVVILPAVTCTTSEDTRHNAAVGPGGDGLSQAATSPTLVSQQDSAAADTASSTSASIDNLISTADLSLPAPITSDRLVVADVPLPDLAWTYSVPPEQQEPTPLSMEGRPSTDQSGTLLLHVPVADGEGGLFDRASVRPVSRTLNVAASGSWSCAAIGHEIRGSVQLFGSRLQTFYRPKAPRW